jgi:hypothetical protein
MTQAEVTRHATNCSSESWFHHMVHLYVVRQLYRGFPSDKLLEWVSTVSYSSVRSRILCNTDRAAGGDRRVPLYLKLQYDDISSALAAPMTMHLFADKVLTGRSHLGDRTLVCWCRGTNLGSRLWSSQDAAKSSERDPTPNP